MANKTVMAVDLCCDKCKKIALHSVTKIEGIDSLSIDMKQRTLTVIGDADPVGVANMLRKKFRCAKLISAGTVTAPPPRPKEDDKKGKEDKTKGAKIEETPNVVPKGALKKVRFAEAISPQPMSYTVCEAQCYPPCPDCSNREEILWPRYQDPSDPNEVSYVWNEEKHDPCRTM